MAVFAEPDWMPPRSVGARIVPCGRWWDAVVVPREDGERVLRLLDGRSGALIADDARSTLTWLVAPGETHRWGRVGRVTLLGTGRTLEIPPAAWRRGYALRWALPPAGDCLTDAGALLDALIAVLKARGLPHPFPPVRALRRCGCGALVVDGEAHACARG
jgi:hypothetical protein